MQRHKVVRSILGRSSVMMFLIDDRIDRCLQPRRRYIALLVRTTVMQ